MTHAPSDRTRVRRVPDRGRYDRESLYAVLDAGFVCHVGFVHEGRPAVVPMVYARDGHRLLVHGARSSRAMRAMASGEPVCIAVTHVDGLVLSRSVFHHSVNYRSAVVYARGRAIDDADERRDALRALVEGVTPGRWEACRPPNARELEATAVVEFPLDEASVKVREHGAEDEPEDLALDAWAGVVPLRVAVGAPVPHEGPEPIRAGPLPAPECDADGRPLPPEVRDVVRRYARG